VAIGKGGVKREGRILDHRLLSDGSACLEGRGSGKKGNQCGVVDPRTLLPLDEEIILKS